MKTISRKFFLKSINILKREKKEGMTRYISDDLEISSDDSDESNKQ